ncbi:hypothetical protein LINGRAHAP2_LOCUS24472, partial [Linum grandiflorum]
TIKLDLKYYSSQFISFLPIRCCHQQLPPPPLPLLVLVLNPKRDCRFLTVKKCQVEDLIRLIDKVDS